VSVCTPAHADDDPPEDLDDFAPAPPTEDALPQALATRDRVIPDSSFEFAIQYSYGGVVGLTERVAPGVGVGLRGSWGKHLGQHRVGFSVVQMVEGQIASSTLYATDVEATWNHVGSTGLLVGAGLGGTLGVIAIHEEEGRVLVAPTASARVGGSQTWSRYQRRLFVFAEGKLRVADGDVVGLVALCIGAGKGAGEYRPR
jgi:hypothetical protein